MIWLNTTEKYGGLMERLLKRKLNYFFSTHYRARDDIQATLSQLRALGQLALVGGMMRHLALFGNAGFRSDLDFVINPWNIEDFEKKMLSMGAKENRFGGYSLPSRKWQIDVWPLQRTWARVAGHVPVRTFNDLRQATFFTSDAIVYHLSSRTAVTTTDYFEKLNSRIL